MNSTEKLLSIQNLKKYFPVSETKLFQKERLYVRANEEVSLDIYSGETVGLVGESGCGKSTLGRTILQLYEQTAGSTMYYGRTLEQVAPDYVEFTFQNAGKMIKEYKRLREKAEECEKICQQAGENASFIQQQSRHIARAEAETAFLKVVKLLGGFAVLQDCTEGASLLLKKFQAGVKTARLQEQLRTCGDNRQKLRLTGEIQKAENDYAQWKTQVDALKQRYTENSEFAAFEAYLDNGIDLSRLSDLEMRSLRSDLQIIFQDPYSSLNPRMTVGQLIAEGLVTHGFFKQGDPAMQEYILQIMEQCGLQPHMLHRYPHQFSGGQRQRISIARALGVKPKFVVCDECVSALDVSIQSQIINLLQELKQTQGLTYLFISHDLSVVRHISDRIGVMYLGNIVELGPAEAVFSDPRHPYTVALLSSIPTTDPDGAKRERIILEGSIPSPIKPPVGCKFHTRCYMAQKKCRQELPPIVEVGQGHYTVCHFPERKLDKQGERLFQSPRSNGAEWDEI